MSGRIDADKRVVAVMINFYCAAHHRTQRSDGGDLCQDCAALFAYAEKQLDRCPFGEAKTTCANCAVHCYRPAERERIRGIMRYAGPRMILMHPLLAVQHLLAARREK